VEIRARARCRPLLVPLGAPRDGMSSGGHIFARACRRVASAQERGGAREDEKTEKNHDQVLTHVKTPLFGKRLVETARRRMAIDSETAWIEKATNWSSAPRKWPSAINGLTRSQMRGRMGSVLPTSTACSK
jgi:hypothetical protein